MTKAALCVACWDIVSPRRAWQTDRSWRWCECGHTGVRWRDGAKGLVEVTSLHGAEGVHVLGLNNLFLTSAIQMSRAGLTFEEWRHLHELTSERVEPHYLFHADKRNCWALVVRPSESSDVSFIEYGTAKRDNLTGSGAS
jgi:hypothetical protein